MRERGHPAALTAVVPSRTIVPLAATKGGEMLRRVSLAVVMLAACIASLVTAANAAKPIRNPFVAPPPTTFPAGLVCPFEVYVETVENGQTQTIFSDGTIKITGFFSTRVVNAENDEELTLVSGGSVRLSPEGANLRVEIRDPSSSSFSRGTPARATPPWDGRTTSMDTRRGWSIRRRSQDSPSSITARPPTSARRSPEDWGYEGDGHATVPLLL